MNMDQVGEMMIDNDFFNVELIGDRMWLIAGKPYDLMYLIVGDKYAMLIDTGTGIGDLRSLIETLTDLPYIVVNTHGHPDHAGGNSQFEEVWIHHDDVDTMRRMCTDEARLNDFPRYFGADETEIKKNKDNLVRFNNSFKIGELRDGFVIDLGGRCFEVIETPGHSKGSVCFINKSERILFVGDSVCPVTWIQFDSSTDVVTFNKSLKKLSKRIDEFDVIYRFHKPHIVTPTILRDLVVCTDEIIASKTPIGKKKVTFLGEAMIWGFGEARVLYNPENIGN